MMGIALRHHRRFVPQRPLHLVQIHTGLDQPRRERVAQVMEMNILKTALDKAILKARRRWLGLIAVPARPGKSGCKRT